MDYDPVAKNFEQYGETAVTDWVLGLNIVAEVLQPVTNKKILDYGCGTGRFSRFLAEQGAKVTGTDISQEMIRIAQTQSENRIDYKQSSSGDLSFLPPNSFDAVVASFVLCTVSTRQEMQHIVAEIRRVLKVGGLFVILNPNWEEFNGHESISAKFDHVVPLISGGKVGGILKGETPIRVDDYFWSRTDYFGFLQEAGFRNIEVKQPRAEGDDYPWIDEKEYSPFFIIRGEKE